MSLTMRTRMRGEELAGEKVVDPDEITDEALEFLRTRLENHSFSITYHPFPLMFSDEASASEHLIKVPLPKELTQEELELVYAMQIHESAHVLYSSLDFKRIHKFFLDNKMQVKLAHELFNIIEDYRVNMLIGVSHPGAGRIMDAVHRRLVKKRNDEMGPYTSAFEALCAELCGYPSEKKLDKKEEEKLEKALDLVWPIVLCKDLDATLQVMPAVYKLFEDREGLSEGGEPCEGEDMDGEGMGGFSYSGMTAPSSETSLLGGGTAHDKLPSLPDREVKKKTEEAVKKMEKKSIEHRVKELTPEEREAVTKEFRDIEKVFAEIKKIHVKAVEKEKAKLEKLERLEKVVKESDGVTATHRFERRKNRAFYERYVKKNRRQIDKLVREIKTMILFSKGFRSGQRTGKLNGKKAYRLVTSADPRIFRKKIDHKNVGDLAVVLLQDVSGSMGCGGKIENCRQACIILHEVFSKLKVKHMIVGYTADLKGYSVDHIIYKYWDDAVTAYNLSEIDAICENRDGPSVRLATGYFKDVTERNKLLIIISDGYPAAGGYGGKEGIIDTVQAHKEAIRRGIKLINIGIGEGYHLPKEYENKVKVDHVEDLPKELTKLLRRELTR